MHKNRYPKREQERNLSSAHSRRNRQQTGTVSSTPFSLEKYFFSTYDLEHSDGKKSYSTSYGNTRATTVEKVSDELTASSNTVHRTQIVDGRLEEIEAVDSAEREYEEGEFLLSSLK